MLRAEGVLDWHSGEARGPCRPGVGSREGGGCGPPGLIAVLGALGLPRETPGAGGAWPGGRAGQRSHTLQGHPRGSDKPHQASLVADG